MGRLDMASGLALNLKVRHSKTEIRFDGYQPVIPLPKG
jgi:hypothetical protein